MDEVERRLPDDPVAFIRACVRAGRLLWTYHAHMRLAGRGISRSEIVGAEANYQIVGAEATYQFVEAYPDDKYLPSYLVVSSGRIHVLFAVDVEQDNVRVVTAYRPDPAEWAADGRTRRKGV